MKTMVKEIITEGEYVSNDNVSLNIAYGVDKNFIFGAAISMTSILRHNKAIPIIFHIFTDYIDADFSSKIKRLSEEYKTRINIYILHSGSFSTLPRTQNWSHAMYFRFICFDVLSNQLDKLLYLDGDVICKGSLSDLHQLSLGDYYAAVVKDTEDMQQLSDRLKINGLNGNYFNSGVILANLCKWKEHRFTSKAMAVFADEEIRNRLFFFDQDVLNILFFGHVLFLDKAYNSFYCLKLEIRVKNINIYKEYITDNTVLIHYTGVTKPWHEWAINYPAASYFREAYENSPWRGTPLKVANNSKLFKKRSQHEWYQKKYILSIITHINYLISKMKG